MGIITLEVCEVLNFINHGSVRNVGVGVYVSSLEVCGCGLYNALVCMEFDGLSIMIVNAIWGCNVCGSVVWVCL